MKTVKIYGELYTPNGLPAKHLTGVAILNQYSVDGGLIVPMTTEFKTDEDGSFEIDLWPNSRGSKFSRYIVKVSTYEETVLDVVIRVPDLDTPININDIILQPPYPPINQALEALIKSQEAALRSINATEDVVILRDEILSLDTSADNSSKLSRDWAIKLDDLVDGEDYSSKHYAIESKRYSDNIGTAAEDAENSASRAKASETASGLSETNTKTSETNAKASEDAAKASEDASKTSEINSKDSEDASKASEVAAKLSEDAAKASEIASGLSEDNAKTSETNAKASENAAKASQTASKASEDSASASATVATTKASEASASATNSSNSADAAKTSETNSKASEVAAKDSETASASSESKAKASENAAKISETNAKTSETKAKASEAASDSSATSASGSATVASEQATIATNASDASNTSATTSANSADASATSAEESRLSAEASETSNQSATAQATIATEAKDEVVVLRDEILSLEQSSEDSAKLSRDWAIKLDDLVDGEDYSSKYYSNQSKGFSEASETSSNSAETSSVNAKASEDNALASEQAAKTSETNAKNSANDSAASASSASTSESNAAASESVASTKASDASASATAASGSATVASNKADEASSSATAAENSASDAETSKTQASTFASDAASSASSAETAKDDTYSYLNKAKDWATKLDTPVEGDEYSAKHWAKYAETVSATNHATETVIGISRFGTQEEVIDGILDNVTVSPKHLKEVSDTKVDKASLTTKLPRTSPSLNFNFMKVKHFDPKVEFTRESTATYTDVMGIIHTAAIDEPRFTYDPATGEALGLLLEGQATNLILHSEFENGKSDLVGAHSQTSPAMEVGGPFWSLSNSIRVVPENDLIQNIECRLSAGSAALDTDHTLCLFVETESDEEFTLGPRDSATANATPLLFNQNASTYSVRRIESRLYQVIATGRRNAFSNAFGLLVAPSHKRSPFRVSGFSLYEGVYTFSSLPSYIPTEGSQVTRAADSADIPTNAFPFNPLEGTFIIDMIGSPPANAFADSVFSLSESPSSYLLTIELSAQPRLRSVFSGYDSLNLPTDYVGGPAKIAISFGKDAIIFAVNGIVRETSNLIAKQAYEQAKHVTLGRAGSEDRRAAGTYRAVTYYPRALTDAELQELTS